MLGTTDEQDLIDDTPLKFSHLLCSPAFNSMMGPSYKPVDHAMTKDSLKSCEKRRFPSLAKEHRDRLTSLTIEEFLLNEEQAGAAMLSMTQLYPIEYSNASIVFGVGLLRRVSCWFQTDREKCGGILEEDNIILVDGVFGAGKSHLLAALCVLIKVPSTDAYFECISECRLLSTASL